jgi:biotin carboxyl carrier protein
VRRVAAFGGHLGGADASLLTTAAGGGRSTLQDGVGAQALALARMVAEKGSQARAGEDQGMAVVNVKSEIAGNVWKIQLKPGDKVEVEGEIMILESMKMEIPVLSPKAGTIKEIRVSEGEAIGEGHLVAVIDA